MAASNQHARGADDRDLQLDGPSPTERDGELEELLRALPPVAREAAEA